MIAFDPEEQVVRPSRRRLPGQTRHVRSSAFSLIELLVAIAVMAFLVLAVDALLTGTASLIELSDKKMDSDGEARMVFDRMAEDFASMVKRSDVDYQFNNQSGQQNGSDTLFFYSEAPAISASATAADNSSVSLVGYCITLNSQNNQYQLTRLGKGLQWAPTSGPPDGNGMVHLTYASYPVTSTSTPVTASTLGDVFQDVLAPGSTDTNYHILGEGVFRLAFWFLLKPYQQADGTYAPAIYSVYPYDTRRTHTSLNGIGLEDVQAIVVDIAILDAATRQQLASSITWSKLAAALPDATAATQSSLGWESIVATPTFAHAAGDMPIAAAGQVRVFQRTFNLVTPSNQ